ncbi:MAG: hypothetical protein EBV34_13910, partial [Betaproteobacteria bacterium]|nr:hypothetical protein [Betaproteobacteria bacterium]
MITSEPVWVQGDPSLSLGLESGPKTARYAGGSGTTALTFNYTVGFGDLATTGITLSGSLSGAVKDAAGNPLGGLENVGDLRGIRINGAVVGSAVDGPLINTVIFADADGDNSIDPGESVGGSIGPGVFSIPGGSGRLIMRGGEDISTGQAFEVQYEAPEGYEIINPISTLIAQFQDLSGSNAAGVAKQRTPRAAENLVIQAGLFGNTVATLDVSALASYEAFFQAANKSNATSTQKLAAIAYQKHAAMLATLAASGGKVLSTLSGAQSTELAKPVTDTSVAIVQAVADQLASALSPSIDLLPGLLSSTESIKRVLVDASSALSIALSSSQTDSLNRVAEVLVGANGLIAAVDTTPLLASGLSSQQLSDLAIEALRGIVAVQQVVQETATAGLQAFVLAPSNTAVTDLLLAQSDTEGSLGQLAANTVVGTIVPSRFTVSVASTDAPANATGELSVFEGTSSGADQRVTYTITRAGGLGGTIVLRYEVSGAATLTATRFTGLNDSALPSGQIKFGPGETVKTLGFGLTNDSVDQPNELIVLRLTDVYGNSQFANVDGSLLSYGEARVLLRDDDPNSPLIIGPKTDDPTTPAIEAANKLTLLANTPSKLPALSVDYFDTSALFTASISANGAKLNAPGILVESSTPGTWNIVASTGVGSTNALSLDQLNLALTILSQAQALEATASGGLTVSVKPQGRNIEGTYQIELDTRHPPTLSLPQSFESVIAKTQTTLSAATGSSSITIADTDSKNLTVTVETASGSLSLAGTPDVFVANTANGLTLSGGPNALSRALGSLGFEANAGIRSAAFRITITDNDPFTDADGIATNDLDWDRQFSVEVKSSPPSLSLPESVQVQLGESVNLKGIRLSDTDSQSVTLSLVPNVGRIDLPTGSAGIIVASEGLGVRLQGSPQALQSLLDAGLAFRGPSDGRVVPSVEVTATDGEQNSARQRISVTLLDNAPPVAGGDVSASAFNDTIESSSLAEDAPATLVRLRPLLLVNPDGSDPETIRILSVDGATINATDGSPITLGALGTSIELLDGAASLRLTPQRDRNLPITIRYVVVDPQIESIVSESSIATLILDPINDAPVVELATGGLSYREGDGLIKPVQALRLSDVDSTSLQRATVAISSGYQTGDVLAFTPDTEAFGNISGRFDSATGVLALSTSGVGATVQQFERALRSVSFLNVSDALASGSRTISVQVTDSSGSATAISVVAERELEVIGVNDPPAIDGLADLRYAESTTILKGVTQLVAGSLTLSDPDGNTQLIRSASARLGTGFRPSEDLLSVAAINDGITPSYDSATGVLSLTGNASLAAYQARLRTLAYRNSAASPDTRTRTLTITLIDDDGGIGTSRASIEIVPFDDPPVVDLNGPVATGSSSNATALAGQLTRIAPLASLNDPDAGPSRSSGGAALAGSMSLTVTILDPQSGDGLRLSDAARSAVTAGGLAVSAQSYTGTTFSSIGALPFDENLIRLRLSPPLETGSADPLFSSVLQSFQLSLQGIEFTSTSGSGSRDISVEFSTSPSNQDQAVVKVTLETVPFARAAFGTLSLSGSPQQTF